MANLDFYKGTILDQNYSPSRGLGNIPAGPVAGTYRNAQPAASPSLLTMMGGSHAGNTGGATPVSIPGTAYGSNLIGKNQATFGGDNPNQVGYPASPFGGKYSPYGGWVDDGSTVPLSSSTVFKEQRPVSLTVKGAGMDDLGSGTSWAEVQRMLMQQGADPGMQGLPGFGSTPMSPGIAPQQPPADGSVGLPKWKGPAVKPPPTTFNGSSTGKPYNIGQTYSSGGYMFEMTPNGPKQVGRDPNGVIPQTYQGTPQAAASAQRREALTAGTQPQQNAIQSMGDIGWLMKQLGNTAPKVGQTYGAGGNNYTYTADGFQPTPKTGK